MLPFLKNSFSVFSKARSSAFGLINQNGSQTLNNEFLLPSSYDIFQVRGRKRCLKGTISRQQRLEKRLKREAKEAARKQYNFMEKIQIRRMKSLLSPSEQHPGRYIPENETSLPDHPTTNVFFNHQVKTQFYPITEALKMHRELQQPAIFNNPKGFIKLRIELNMTTKKKTKMIANSDHIIPVPYPVETKEKRAILAFVADPQLQELAVESGAELALGPDVIKKIIKGQFRIDDYDFCVAHSDMGSSILPLRGILKSRLPTKNNGAFGEDLPEMIDKFKKGVRMNVVGDPVYPQWGLSTPVIGTLNMTDDEILCNIKTIIQALCNLRDPNLGPFINRAVMMVGKNQFYVPVDVNEYIPVEKEEEKK
ncbi:39S ribosomal protein L1, mitochondrial [Strongyloides ratti]|uniref:39S ribosomal protein L1, mitochondrial n=1 Tax=Strongyloides ratti TaxID=34506 RepID=A0A090LD74_STRRB|nr:39S ribosomal protein L1, mitochondrial [Strongyloides ratti]CEF65480.1 39S ribosomal protein L1, mitochondrial [Strongyloides ratti]